MTCRPAGFSLAEVLVALVLLATGALALAAAAQRLGSAARAHAERDRAAAAAAWVLDSLLAADTVAAGADTAGRLGIAWGERGGAVWTGVVGPQGRAIVMLRALRGPRLPALPVPP